ncbi:MAG TPA: homoserine kinase [Pseudonocardia sp.]|nr:homoserine kinase [Pseudonocardia sp.]
MAPSEIKITVPASSANLGPGFDALGLALGRYDELEAAVAADGLVIEIEGEGAAEVPRDERHLVVRAMRAMFEVLGEQPAGLRLRCLNRVPHSRGLGSSAAAAVAGAVAASALAGRELAEISDTILQVAAGLEGHADNAAASLYGGFVVAWKVDGQNSESSGNNRPSYGAVRLEPHAQLRPIAFIPATESSTATTRGLLPEQIPLADAAFTASRSSLSVCAFTQRPELLFAATEDRLHQPYRRPAYPESSDLVDALRSRGVPAVISGAGPTVLALPVGGELPADLVCPGFTVTPIDVDRHGVVLEKG